MLYDHWSQVPESEWRWPSFAPDEPRLACPCCGAFFLDADAMDRLQAVRNALGRPLRVNSGHRCPIHNARVGGAPLSMHKMRIAFDLDLAGHDPSRLLAACRGAGFNGFGFYATFLHVDTGRPRRWGTKAGRKTWTGLVTF